MNCTTARGMLEAAVLGVLSDIDRRRFDSHVAGCAQCRAALAKVTATADALRVCTTPGPLPITRVESMRRAVGEALDSGSLAGSHRSGFRHLRVWAAAACAVVAVGTAGAMWQAMRGDPRLGASFQTWTHPGLSVASTTDVFAPVAGPVSVYAFQNTPAGAMVTALDLEGGGQLWRSTAPSMGFLSTDHAHVYSVSAEKGREGSLVALDGGTGEVRWHFAPPDARGIRGRAVPAGTRVLWPAGATLWALDTASGDVLWSVIGVSGGVSQPLCVMDRVLTMAGGELQCLDSRDGARVWVATIADEAPVLARAVMDFAENRLFVSHAGGGLAGHVTCVDARDGGIVWDRDGIGGAQLIACGSVVYVRDRQVSALDAASGKTLWQRTAEGCSPLYCYHGNVVYADASRRDALTVLDGLTGKPRTRVSLPNACSGFVPTATVLGLVVDNDGVLHAIDTREAFGSI